MEKEPLSIDEMIEKKKNNKKHKHLLIKFKKNYEDTDRIVVEEFKTYFKITVAHQGNEKYTGGAECYELNKKNGKTKMIWHEHPMEIPELKENKE